jgi:hypothetical protein
MLYIDAIVITFKDKTTFFSCFAKNENRKRKNVKL